MGKQILVRNCEINKLSFYFQLLHCLRTWLFSLLFPQCEEGDTRDLDDLETDTWNITLSLTLSTETGEEDFVILVNKVQTTVIWNEGSDLLTVLDELDSDTLSDSGVWLLSFDTELFEDNTLSVGRTTKWRRLEGSSQKSLLEGLVGPTANL